MAAKTLTTKANSLKRKTLHDYFNPSTKHDKPKQDAEPTKPQSPSSIQGSHLRSQSNPSTTLTSRHVNKNTNLPPGLSMIPDFITPDEEQTLLTFLSTQSWRTDLARRVIHYGGTYCLLPPRTATPTERKKIESTIITADNIPPALDFLITRMSSPPSEIFSPTNKPQYCIVNEYKSTHGISAHVENFRFDEPVVGLTLCSGDFMRFHELSVPNDGSVRSGKAAKAERTGRRCDVWMPVRGLVVMRGESRWRWQHEIVRGKRKESGDGKEWKRVSLTFRCEKVK